MVRNTASCCTGLPGLSGNSDSVAEAGRSNAVVEAEASVLCDFIGAGGSIGAGNLRVALPIVPAKVRVLGRCVKTCALLDTGSTNSFCSAALLKHLGITGIKQSLSLTTLGMKDSIVQTEKVRLQVMDIDEYNALDLPCVFMRAQLPVHIGNWAQSQDINLWPHLDGIDLPQVSIGEVSLLINQNTTAALTPFKVKIGASGAPYAVKTLLGWTLNGPLSVSS